MNLTNQCLKIINFLKSHKMRKSSGREFSKYPLLLSRFRKIVNDKRVTKTAYAWGVLCGVDLAKTLGIDKVSIIEFGVAGGDGLVCLEHIASRIEMMYNVKLDIYGFDTGTGLPKPKDHRDLPHMWGAGHFPMDVEKLQERLKKAKLILGDVKDTVSDFIKSKPAPIAFIAFDLDLYSSTMQAFKLLEADQKLFLPRVPCYFDDITGYSYSDFTGERLAISDFNKSHESRKISKIYCLRYYIQEYTALWTEKMYLAHIFNHDLYGKNDGMVQVNKMPLVCI